MITNCWQACCGAWTESCSSYFLANGSVVTEVVTTAFSPGPAATLPSFLSYSLKSP